MYIEDDLIKSCLAKDRVAQKQLYKALLPYLRAVANRYLKNTSYVKDVLQESFVKIFNKMEKYDPEKAPFDKWASKIVVNDCLNYNTRIIGTTSEEFDNDKHEIICFPKVIKDLSNEHLLFVLKQMPTAYFEVFNLHVIDEYKHDEIAKMLNITIELSRKRLSRAKAWMKKTFNSNIQLSKTLLSFPEKFN